MPKKPIQQVGRIAFREEGDNWNAYYCTTTDMEGALYLGSLAMGIALIPERKAQFMQLMRDGVSDLMERTTGIRPVWPAPGGVPAPDHEKTRKG